MAKNPCKSCSGKGRVERSKTVKFNIPAGVESGMSIRLAGKGEAGEKGAKAGDLYVNISIQPDSMFERDGDNIICEAAINFTTAVLGGIISLKAIDGSQVTLNIPEGTQVGEKFRIKGKGMPIMNAGGRKGDMIAIINIYVPTDLTKDQKHIIESLAKSMPENSDTNRANNNFFKKIKDLFK
jgi:molecular chaperone DnaJ